MIGQKSNEAFLLTNRSIIVIGKEKEISGRVSFSNGCRLNRKTRITRWPGRKYRGRRDKPTTHRRWDEMNQ